VDVSYESVRYRWHRFGSQFANQIKKRRAGGMQSSNWKWHLDEVFVKINGERYYLWRAVDHEGEVLESYVTKKRDKKAALKFMKKLCFGIDRPMRLSQISYDPTVQQQKSLAVQISKLPSGGRTT
jgi:putative transposase